MAVKHAASMGRSNVKLPVNSMASTMPVTGARTTAVKKSGHPHHSVGHWVCPNMRAPETADGAKHVPKLSAQDEHWREKASRRLRSIRERPQGKSDQETDENCREHIVTGKNPLGDGISSPDNVWVNPCQYGY